VSERTDRDDIVVGRDGAEDSLGPSGVAVTRSAAIAWLRVMAMTGVVLVHVAGPVVVRDDLAGTPMELLAAILNGATRFGVPLFVVVSGALLLQARSFRSGTGDFYRRRLGRILPALVVWHMVYLVFRGVVLDEDLGTERTLALLLTGTVYPGLYFFWVVLGLSLVAPLLWRAIEPMTVAHRLVLGVVLIVLVELWFGTLGVLTWTGQSVTAGTQTIWTVWLPYVGLFVLGGALRDVAPRAWSGRLGLAVFLTGAAAVTWQRLGAAPELLETLSPFSRWSVFVIAATVGLWFAGTWYWREGTWAATSWRARLGDALGSVTLGVFGLHFLVLYVAKGALTPGIAAGSIQVPGLLALAAVTLVVSWALAWGMSKVPLLRRIV
jgi:surface polysaccharide O-acyltransferase-like enzyme